MKKVFLIVAMFLSVGVYSTSAQTVQVPQDVVDRCAKCFDEAVALRETVTALKEGKARDAATIQSLEQLVDLYVKLSASDKEEIRDLRNTVKELITSIINRPTKKCVGFINFWC